MSKYAVNHSEDLRALKCFLTESVSQPGSPRMTKTLIGVFRLVAAAGVAAAALDHPSPPHNSSLHNPKAVQTQGRNQNGLLSDVVQLGVLFENQVNAGPAAQTIYLAARLHSHES